MSSRAAELAAKLRQVNAGAIAFVEAIPDGQWFAPVAVENRTVAASVYHIAQAYRAEGAVMRAIASSTQVPDAFHDWEKIHAANAIGARENERVSKQDAIASLKRRGDELAASLESLTDEQLDQRQYVGILKAEVSTEEFVTMVILDHPQGHVANIKDALAGAAGGT